MRIYRFLTGKDDAAFCHKVTKALSEGWELYGDPQYLSDVWGWSGAFKCGQAVIKEVEDQPYDPEKKLVDY